MKVKVKELVNSGQLEFMYDFHLLIDMPVLCFMSSSFIIYENVKLLCNLM
jgi:hypothetical protein